MLISRLVGRRKNYLLYEIFKPVICRVLPFEIGGHSRLDHLGRDLDLIPTGFCRWPRCPVGHFLYLGLCGVKYIIPPLKKEHIANIEQIVYIQTSMAVGRDTGKGALF